MTTDDCFEKKRILNLAMGFKTSAEEMSNPANLIIIAVTKFGNPDALKSTIDGPINVVGDV